MNRTVSPVLTQITEFLVWVMFIDILDVLHHWFSGFSSIDGTIQKVCPHCKWTESWFSLTNVVGPGCCMFHTCYCGSHQKKCADFMQWTKRLPSLTAELSCFIQPVHRWSFANYVLLFLSWISTAPNRWQMSKMVHSFTTSIFCSVCVCCMFLSLILFSTYC